MRQQQRQPPVALVLRTVLLVALARPARAVVLSCEATTGDGLSLGASARLTQQRETPRSSFVRRQEVDVIEKDMTLALTCAELDLAVVKAALAESWGCDVALITLSNPCAAASSESNLTITMKLASPAIAPNGSDVSAPMNDVLSAVQATSDADLSSWLSSALSRAVFVPPSPASPPGSPTPVTASSRTGTAAPLPPGATVAVSSTAPTQGNATMAISLECPSGKWRYGLMSSALAGPAGGCDASGDASGSGSGNGE